MQRFTTIDEYISNAKNGKELLIILRKILSTTELSETIKWGEPCYTLNGKNVLGLGSFKSYVVIWFFQGALLKDPHKLLLNAQEDKTRAMRQWRFKSMKDIDEKKVLAYVNEAIENQKQNKTILANRKKPLIIPPQLQDAFNADTDFKKAFEDFSRGKQREFAEYISEAKQEKTKLARLQKIEPLIRQKIGLHDKYRK